MTDLYFRYRRLLVAYPRDYRRHRGAEIVTTYTEMAAEGQRWPRGRDAVSLLRHGLRARLGRPRGRLVVPLTVLAMLVGGLCAAAGGARAGWGASIGLNARQAAEVDQLATSAQATFTTWVGRGDETPDWLLGYLFMPAWGKSPEVVESPVDATTGQPTSPWPGPNPRGLVDQERVRLAGSDWTVTSQTATDTEATMVIHNGDLIAHLDASLGWTEFSFMPVAGHPTPLGVDCPIGQFPPFLSATQPGPAGVNSPDCMVTWNSASGSDGFYASVYRATPATVPVFAVLAGLLGAVMTYLLVGWLNRRADRLGRWWRRVVAAGLTLTTALAVPAATVCAAGLWVVMRYPSDAPIRFWGGFVTGDARPAALWAAVLLVAVLAGAALTRPARPAAEATQ